MNRDQYLSKRKRLYGEPFPTNTKAASGRPADDGRDAAPDNYRVRQETQARDARRGNASELAEICPAVENGPQG